MTAANGTASRKRIRRNMVASLPVRGPISVVVLPGSLTPPDMPVAASSGHITVQYRASGNLRA